MRWGAFCRMLLVAALLAFATGLLIPVLVGDVIDDRQQQRMAETVVEEAAWWYVTHQGTPMETLRTEQVKEVLIPDYLTKWPGKQPIQCEIDSRGNIIVRTINDNSKTTWKDRIRHFYTWVSTA